jgi:carboxylesterase type B
VRDNIAQFEVIPRIVIFGESGGGTKVTCLLAMPPQVPSSAVACAMSGAILEARTPEHAR